MAFTKEILILLMAFILVEGNYSAKPVISVTCEKTRMKARVMFTKPFSGTVFPQGYYSDPYCSSQNLRNVNSQDITLTLPLFMCGTVLKKRKNRPPVIKNTLQIQYHPMIKTKYDTAENISCSYEWPVPNEYWILSRQKVDKTPVFPYRSWLNFRMGNDVMGENEARDKGVSYKLFLVAYLQDGGRNKDFNVGKCFAHNEQILTENSTIFEMNPEDSCSELSSLSAFTVKPYLPISDLMAYAEILAFNISTKGELFITCGMQVCEDSCFRGCLEDYRDEINHWSTVSTHRLSKRSADDQSSSKLRSLENRNIFLRSTVKALTERLVQFKTQLDAQRNRTGFDRRVSKSMTPVEDSSQLDFNQMTETTRTTSTEESFTDQDNTDIVEKTIDEVASTKVTVMTTEIATEHNETMTENIKEESTTINNTLNFVSNADIEEPLTVMVDKQLSTVSLQNTTIFLPALYMDYFMTTGLPQYNRSTASYEPNTVYVITTDDVFKREEPSQNISVINNTTDTTQDELLLNKAMVQDCVPQIKFLVVTISLGILSLSFFLICVGMWLYIRKERKRTALNSYLLYSFN